MKYKATAIKILTLILIFPFAMLYGQDKLVISEFMAINNASIMDEDSTYSDWIEIFNGSPLPIDLSGWCLTDEVGNLAKWSFPSIEIEPNEYLLVFASGKNRLVEKDKLHTNFKLSGSGEYLALSKPGESVFASEFNPNFPVQYDNISYAYISGTYNYTIHSSPGAENKTGIFTTPPIFSEQHNFYDAPFNLELSSDQSNAKIYYTTDASTPDIKNGILYTDPIHITKTTVIRTIAIIEGESSVTKTSTFIFPEDVFHQTENQPGYPNSWLIPTSYMKYDEIDTHYGMNSGVLKMEAVSQNLISSIKSLPIISVVTDIDNLFSKDIDPNTGGIYMYSGESDGGTAGLKYHVGRGWERPASVEYFNSNTDDGEIDFQENCGIKIHGGASRSTRKTLKRSLKIGFKSVYGPSKLDEKLFGKGSPKQYDRLILRGGFDRRLENQVVDPWVKATMRDMDEYAARSKFVHLYLNGMYWGMYNLSEQMDDNCMRDNLGGKASDYDIIKDYYEVEAGDTKAWDRMISLAKRIRTNPETYQYLIGNKPDGTPDPSIEKLLNAPNLADYIINIMYNNPSDWDKHNWAAARRKTKSEGFHFLVWDAESGLSDGNKVSNVMDKGLDNRPSGLFADLMTSQDFKNLVISRINRSFFEDGALTPDPGLVRYKNIFEEFDTALIADQARWYADEDDIWNISHHTWIDDYFEDRTEEVFNQFISKGLYPRIAKPVFNSNLSRIPEDFELLFAVPEGAEIRYSIDGTDPGYYHLETNSIIVYDKTALALPPVGEKLTIKARTKQDTLWSGLITKTFTIEKANEVGVNDMLFAENGYLKNAPNPGREYTHITYNLPVSSHVSLKVYDMMGKCISTLVNGNKEQGEHVINWNMESIPKGAYLCVLEEYSSSIRYRIKIIKE